MVIAPPSGPETSVRCIRGLMTVTMRNPSVADGPRLWAMIRDTPDLDLNSPYCYLLLADHFTDTCVLAEFGGEPVGAVLAYAKPGDPTTLFVWQVVVARTHRELGIGRRMLDHLVTRVAPVRLEATVGPSNHASRRMFQSLARRRGAEFESRPWLGAEDFPEPGHEAEDLIRIGPFNPAHSGAPGGAAGIDDHARMASS